jgi:hypothetical protein
MLERFWRFADEKAAALRRHVAELARAYRPAVVVEVPAEVAPLPVEDRFTRATGALTAAISGFARIESLQAAATSQLDAADYALQRLLEELGMAMPIRAADGSELRALLATVEELDQEALADEARAA